MRFRRREREADAPWPEWVTVGDGCVIKPGAVLGGEGFGYVRSVLGTWTPRPHDRGVILERGVHVGSGTCIDRGRVRDTIVGEGTRIDNLVHVAHGARIGRDCIIVAGALLGGSVEIGDGAWIGLGAMLHQGVRVGPGALVGMGSVVLRDVPSNVTVAGNPARIIDLERGVREGM